MTPTSVANALGFARHLLEIRHAADPPDRLAPPHLLPDIGFGTAALVAGAAVIDSSART
jgi:hypothetical protein